MNYEPFDMTRGRDYERSLQRIATRGIVQLFNTVRKQQQTSSSSLAKKEKKDTTINKGEFLDMLKTIDSDEASYKIMKKNQSTVNICLKRKCFFYFKQILHFRSNQQHQNQSDGMFFKMI
jgi:hypothetical protein